MIVDKRGMIFLINYHLSLIIYYSHGYPKYAYRFDLNPRSSDFGFFYLMVFSLKLRQNGSIDFRYNFNRIISQRIKDNLIKFAVQEFNLKYILLCIQQI